MRIGDLRISPQTARALAAAHATGNRHCRERWFRRFRGVALVAHDLVLAGDRERAAEVLGELLSKREARCWAGLYVPPRERAKPFNFGWSPLIPLQVHDEVFLRLTEDSADRLRASMSELMTRALRYHVSKIEAPRAALYADSV